MAKYKVGKAKKEVWGWNEYQLLRGIVAFAIIIYIVGVVPAYSRAIRDLFHEPIVKLIFLGLIVSVGYLDTVLGVLLAIAFLVSMLSRSQYRSTPLGQAVSGVQSGVRQAIHLPVDVAKEIPLPGQQKENMENESYQTPNAQQAFEMSEQEGNVLYGQGKDCTVIPPPTSGCDPIVGYNAPYDCVCNEDCTPECNKKDRGCLCSGVATWTDELNAQGLNYPMGNPGPQEGATF